MDIYQKSLLIHEQIRGKLSTYSKIPIKTTHDLSIAYTPGVAEACRKISEDPKLAQKYTLKQNSVAIVSDGSAVLGLGDIGPHAAIPVMEGKAILFKQFADIDAWPICLDTHDTEEIIKTIRHIAPTFGGINLEDISAPRCFEIERRLQDLGIPVFHDDQHGTAIVLLAALINACKITGKKLENIKVVINGAGSAGIAIAKLINLQEIDYNPYEVSEGLKAVKNIIVCDSKGAISKDRQDLNTEKKKLLTFTNQNNVKGALSEVLQGADVFIGVSKGNVLQEADIKKMNKDSIIFAMANPIPEIMPDIALKGGARIIGTGRSDFPNQINNVLAFPGIFKGALESKASRISKSMKLAAVVALTKSIEEDQITSEKIIPLPLEKHTANLVAKYVCEAAELDEDRIN